MVLQEIPDHRDHRVIQDPLETQDSQVSKALPDRLASPEHLVLPDLQVTLEAKDRKETKEIQGLLDSREP